MNRIILVSSIFIVALLVACNGSRKNRLSFHDREIIGGLYFGMPQDSIEIVLRQNLQMDNFTIKSCWGTILSPTRKYCYSNFCDFSFAKQVPAFMQMASSEPPFDQGHYGLVIPVVSNKRLSEVYVVLGNFSRKDSNPSFKPFMSANIIDEVSFKLNKEYGRDSLSHESNAQIAILSDLRTDFTYMQSIIHEYKAKFGTVELVRGQLAEDISFSENTYWCSGGGEGPENNPNEDVNWYPCIHYKLDPKYFEELNLNEKL
jgi:hypothetical protein